MVLTQLWCLIKNVLFHQISNYWWDGESSNLHTEPLRADIQSTLYQRLSVAIDTALSGTLSPPFVIRCSI